MRRLNILDRPLPPQTRIIQTNCCWLCSNTQRSHSVSSSQIYCTIFIECQPWTVCTTSCSRSFPTTMTAFSRVPYRLPDVVDDPQLFHQLTLRCQTQTCSTAIHIFLRICTSDCTVTGVNVISSCIRSVTLFRLVDLWGVLLGQLGEEWSYRQHDLRHQTHRCRCWHWRSSVPDRCNASEGIPAVTSSENWTEPQIYWIFISNRRDCSFTPAMITR